MCGICLYITNEEKINVDEIIKNFDIIKYRGPDKTVNTVIKKNDISMILTFHRLAIMDKSDAGSQPFIYHNEKENRTIYMMCNGEIYNYKSLFEKLDNIKDECINGDNRKLSGSDCEVIIPLYLKYGIDKTVELISNNEFAFILIDIVKDDVNVYISRDVAGVRPLFYFANVNEKKFSFGFCSELKGLLSLNKNMTPFPPGHIMKINENKYEFTQYYNYLYKTVDYTNIEMLYEKIRNTLISSVKEKLLSNRPLGSLLSGGLDSSLVASIASKYSQSGENKLKTFTIGMNQSTDIKYAEIMAKYINSDHTTFYTTPEELLKIIPDVIYATETYDITTIRASTPQYMLAKKISEQTDVKVILNGDGSDECTMGYLFFHNAPNEIEAQKENERLIREIYKYDIIRVDRTLSHFGLESRVPFLSRDFIDLYLNIDPKLKIPTKGIEKYLLRKAFEGTGLLPDSVLWRQKEALSDGISEVSKSWFQIIQEYIDKIVSDDEYETESKKYTHNPPTSKESYYYRKIFENYFGKNNEKVIDHMWLPVWTKTTEPSARILNSYKKEF